MYLSPALKRMPHIVRLHTGTHSDFVIFITQLEANIYRILRYSEKASFVLFLYKIGTDINTLPKALLIPDSVTNQLVLDTNDNL